MRRGSLERRPSRMEPEGADSARSCYRLLCEVGALLRLIFNIFINFLFYWL